MASSKPVRIIATTVAALLLAGYQPLAQAGHEQARPAASAGKGDERSLKSRQQVMQEAQNRYGGRVLSIRFRRDRNGLAFYAVRLLKDGQVRVVRVLAEAD